MGKKKNKKSKAQAFDFSACPAWMLDPAQAKAKKNKGWLGALQNNSNHQFLVGALLGAAATYVLSNEQMREKIIRSAVKIYGDVAGGMAELKEQVADLQAELSAQHGEQEQ